MIDLVPRILVLQLQNENTVFKVANNKLVK